MLILASVLLSLSSPVLFSAPVAIQKSDFSKGNYWIWEYQNNMSEVNSWEKYQVTAHKKDTITIVMSTQFPGEQTFTEHHKLKVKLKKCLRAYSNPVDKKPWRLSGFYHLDQGTWKKSGWGHNVQAFEEKFSCYSTEDVAQNHYSYKAQYKYFPAIDQHIEIFQNQHKKPRRGHFDSWYFQDGPQRGVAAYKVFNPDNEEHRYSFHFIESNMGSQS